MSQSPVWVHDEDLYKEFKLKFPDLDIRRPDGNEPSLKKVKVMSVQQISLPYDVKSTNPISPEIVYEVGWVKTAYKKILTERGEVTALSHISGIDPKQPIIFKRLEVGTIVGSYQSGEFQPFLTGNYVTPNITATLDELGIPLDWAVQKTYFSLYEVKEEHFVLETVASAFLGTKGGAKQYFITELEDRAKYEPITFGERLQRVFKS